MPAHILERYGDNFTNCEVVRFRDSKGRVGFWKLLDGLLEAPGSFWRLLEARHLLSSNAVAAPQVLGE